MVEPVPFRRPINWNHLRSDEAEQVIRERSRDTGKVVISQHAYDRMNQRSELHRIIAEDVYQILQTGMVEGTPILEGREWKVIVVKRMPGMREAGVVTLFVKDEDTLFVKTVEWMD